MFHSRNAHKKTGVIMLVQAITLSSFLLAATAWAGTGNADAAAYSFWQAIGSQAAFQAASMIRKQSPQFKTADSIAMTNAGYAEIDGQATMAALDGLSSVLKVSRGNHSLIEIHSSASMPLWFAVYDKRSGNCAYLQLNPAVIENEDVPLFSKETVAQINADHLFAHPAEYGQKFDDKIFGGNEFRIVTIANALAAGVSTKAVRAFEFHDHYCPGVTSGILMAQYIEQHLDFGNIFIQSIQPWCKEDALQAILNTTPGKKSYDVLYPSEDDLAAWPDWANAASTIVYQKSPGAATWTGIALGFEFRETGCSDYGHSILNKLCADLWYLDKMDQPENFITVERTFQLPESSTPQDFARPGVDPVFLIDSL
jgi:formylmethanofuran dehydrogenase subunit E-like metal-binding protein